MAIISLRLNDREERMVNALSDFYEQDRSALIKQSLMAMCEDLIDRHAITEFEQRETTSKVKFVSAETILRGLKKDLRKRQGEKNHN